MIVYKMMQCTMESEIWSQYGSQIMLKTRAEVYTVPLWNVAENISVDERKKNLYKI